MSDRPTTRAVGWLMITGHGVVINEEVRAADEQARNAKAQASKSTEGSEQVATKRGKDLYS